jgi:hypothetical protein
MAEFTTNLLSHPFNYTTERENARRKALRRYRSVAPGLILTFAICSTSLKSRTPSQIRLQFDEQYQANQTRMSMTCRQQHLEKQRRTDELCQEHVLQKGKLLHQQIAAKEGIFCSSTPSSIILVKAKSYSGR